jgi:hypothetical protein
MTPIDLPAARRYGQFQAFLSFPSFLLRVGIDTDGQLAICFPLLVNALLTVFYLYGFSIVT